MTRILLLDLPQVRLVPGCILAALREIDPNLTMIHLHDDWWATAYLSEEGRHIAQGRRALENTRRAIGSLEAKRKRLPRRTIQRCHDRLILALLKAQGGIGCRVYQTIRPDGAIVERVRQDDFYQRHTTESEFWRQCDALDEQAEHDRTADLTDPARANDVWRYQHTLTHSPGITQSKTHRPGSPALASLPTPRASTWIQHPKGA